MRILFHSLRCIIGVLVIVTIGCYAAVTQSSGVGVDVITTTANPNSLQCYVCEDCVDVTSDTPIMACDRSFFISTTSSTTEDPTSPVTEESSSSSSSTTVSTTTPAPVTTTPDEETTETDPVTETSTPSTTSTTKMPTPPTVAPVSTTLLPTPPNPGTAVVPVLIAANESQNITTLVTPIFSLNSSRLLDRQTRQLANPFYTYHCYTIKKQELNNVIVTDRGCARVRTEQAVCQTLEEDNINPSTNTTDITKCFACTMPLCNKAKALAHGSVAILFLTVIITAINQTW